MSHRRNDTCTIDECETKRFSKEYCLKHWRRLKKFGSATAYSYRDPNTFRFIDDYIEIDLRDMRGNILAVCKVDKQFDYLLKHKWGLSAQGYARAYTKDNKLFRMHNVILKPKKGLEIDHINSDKTDNRTSNLRYATRSQNIANTKRKSKTGYKGIYKIANENYWRVEISKDYHRYYLGRYSSLNEAKKVYAQKARELYGEFINLGVNYGS